MRHIMLVASTATIIGTVSAVALPRTGGSVRYSQLRLYGESGCSEENLGELGIYDESINKCQVFPGDDVVRSINFEYNFKGCRLRVYSDAECQLTGRDVATEECLGGDEIYTSYELLCDV